MRVRKIGRWQRATALAACALLWGAGAAGCGGAYQVRLRNETDKTVFAGIMESGPGVNRMHVRMTLGPGAESDLSASREGDERSKLSLMVGDSPNPRDRAIVRSLEKGKNRFVVKRISTGAANAPLTVEREEGGWW